ncbi:uncharacterized protein LOC135463110 isoform X2 [Liolophura sinensis]|uniref:uncharacterized protein LOC135463110 isoform X2 n=1 Tax=Liolophura sinensis TaxID=3198878 RepID=UPI0031596505
MDFTLGLHPQSMERVYMTVFIVIFVGLPHVRGCGSPSRPVVTMCYNNTATFDTIGFATSEKRVQGSSTCTCNLSTDGAGVLIRVEMMPSTDPSCGFNKIVLKSQSPFATRMDCRQVQSSRFSVSETASLQQSLQQRSDAPVCMKYTVISANSFKGKDPLKSKQASFT